MGLHKESSLGLCRSGLLESDRQATDVDGLVHRAGRIVGEGERAADGDLLTVRARRLVHAADVLVVDGPADAGLVAELDDDVEVVEVGTDMPAARVTDLIASRQAAGHGVVRIAAAATLRTLNTAENRLVRGLRCCIVRKNSTLWRFFCSG